MRQIYFENQFFFFQIFWTRLNQICLLTFGMDGPEMTITWFVWICFAGFMTTLYSAYITMALMKPSEIFRPFSNNEQYIESLFQGNYKHLDYREKPRFKCFTKNLCQQMETALKKHGFFSIIPMGHKILF